MTTSRSNPPPPPSVTVTVTAFAARYGVSRRTVWRWVAAGYLDAERLGPRTAVRVKQAGGGKRETP
jgi:hypothetical protein